MMAMAVTSTSPVAPRVKPTTSILNSLRKHTATPPTSDRQERTSFASFKEDRSEIAQSFIDSKTSSYARAQEEAIDDSASIYSNNFEQRSRHELELNAPMAMTNPSSVLNGFICPCEGFRGWKQISVGGRAASRSFGDLRILSKGFTWESSPSKGTTGKKPKNDAGQAMLEKLPMELLGE